MSDDREQWLQQRAYTIWETEGCPEGRDRAHWEQAERELSAVQTAGQDMANLGSGTAEPVVEAKGKRPRRSAPKPATSAAPSRRKKSPELHP